MIGEELPWSQIEAAAADKIARHTRDGKPSLLLAGPTKLPSRKQRFSVIHEGIPRRPPPPSYAKTRSEKMHFCDRVITDDVWGEAQCRQVVEAVESAVRHGLLLPQGPEVSFSPLQPITEEAIGGHAHALLLEALEIIRGAVTHDYHVTRELFCADALLSRLGPVAPDAPSNGLMYWDAHIDKANKRAYDFSATLFLNAKDHDSPTPGQGEAGKEDAASRPPSLPTFLGGDFLFLDADAHRNVCPLPGRLVTFTSGFENPHQTQRISQGHRYALTAWFTTDPEAAFVAS